MCNSDNWVQLIMQFADAFLRFGPVMQLLNSLPGARMIVQCELGLPKE